MPITIVHKATRPTAGHMHRVLVIDDKGVETVHSFGSLELALKFCEAVPDGCKAKYMGPNAQV